MPLYEYECECGQKFEQVHSIADRHNGVCECSKTGKLLISAWGRVEFAAWDTVIGHDGTILSRKQSTEQTPMLPEKEHGGRF
ncbi:MAG: FmdB family zinc ribbon protein [bacterium]